MMTINADVSNKSNARNGQSLLDRDDLECGTEEIKCQYLATKINNALPKNCTLSTTFFDNRRNLLVVQTRLPNQGKKKTILSHLKVFSIRNTSPHLFLTVNTVLLASFCYMILRHPVRRLTSTKSGTNLKLCIYQGQKMFNYNN